MVGVTVHLEGMWWAGQYTWRACGGRDSTLGGYVVVVTVYLEGMWWA